MAHILVDRVKETTTTTGTGTLSLAGAVTGFRAFSAVMANNDTTLYAIVHQTPGEWEVGVGTWTTGNNLARSLIASSTGALVNFSAGTKDVFMTLTPTGSWPILRLVEGAAINWDNADVTLVQTGNILELTGGVLQIGSGVSALTIDPASPNVISTDQILELSAVSGAGEITINSQRVIVSVPIDVAAGNATFPPVQLASGTLMSTATPGAIELDATNLYGATDTGNRGYIPIRHFIRMTGNRTLTSNTNEQTIFNSPANGRITLEAGVYKFEALMRVTTMSATSGNARIDWNGAGTATIDTWMWSAYGFDNTTSAGPIAAQGVFITANESAASIWTAATGTGMSVSARGMFDITSGGTFIPTIDLVTASAAVILAGSYFMCERIGATDVVSVGQWD